MPFADRTDAGRRLAERLLPYHGEDVVVLGLPRGGVPVAFEVAKALDAPLDVIIVRKLGVPFQPELGMGALGEGGVLIVNQDVLRMARVSDAELAAVEDRERAELERRSQRYRGDRPRARLTGRTAIIIDDGIATGSTARAACQVARAQGASRVVLAAPVAPPHTVTELRTDADEVICLETPEFFAAIGQFYGDFSQTSDDEVTSLLERASATAPESTATPASNPGSPFSAVESRAAEQGNMPLRAEDVDVQAGPVHLAGHLVVPTGAVGIVLFAHGSGSGRHSPRNRYVASVLNGSGVATLLVDLLTPAEEHDRANVFDIELLAQRLTHVTKWLRTQPETEGLPVGYFGASTGAGAALWAATEPDMDVAAVVSRGGRPDLAESRLPDVQAPTLLIVGGYDEYVLALNRQAQDQLTCENRLVVVPGATHLFEEPGALRQVAHLASEWFVEKLGARAHAAT
jgi:putative phosphoribosyl transferase